MRQGDTSRLTARGTLQMTREVEKRKGPEHKQPSLEVAMLVRASQVVLLPPMGLLMPLPLMVVVSLGTVENSATRLDHIRVQHHSLHLVVEPEAFVAKNAVLVAQ